MAKTKRPELTIKEPKTANQRVQRWYPLSEHTPPPDEFYKVYSEAMGCYYIARYNPYIGWTDIDGQRIAIITHWCDDEIYLPFPIRNQFNEEIAREYGYNPRYI